MKQSSEKEDPNASIANSQIQASHNIETAVTKAIACIGNENRYQVILSIYFSLAFFFVGFLLLSGSYTYMNPVFECNGLETTEQQACQRLDTCKLLNPYTITAYAKLYCGDEKNTRALIQSMLGIGAILGVLLINLISDYQGRKFSFILALLLGGLSVICLLIGGYAKITYLMMASQILAGFSAINLQSLSYVLSDKLMSKKWMRYSLIVNNSFWCVAEMGMIVFTIWLDWQDMALYFMLCPAILLILLSFFLLVEDPVLLFTKRRYKECINSLTTIAKINGTKQHLEQSIQIITQLRNEGSIHQSQDFPAQLPSKFKYFRLLKNPLVFIPIICIGLVNLGGNINYFALSYSIDSTANSYGVNIFFFGLFQLLGLFPMLFLNSRLPRKYGLIGIIVIQIGCALPFIFWDLSATLQTVLLSAIRFFQMNEYALKIYLQVQTFPQNIQSTSLGLIEFIGQLGKFLAPFLVEFTRSIGISPITIVAASLVIFGIVTLIPVKQTLHTVKRKQKAIESMDSSQKTLMN